MNCAIRPSVEDIHIDLEGDFTFSDSDLFIQMLRELRLSGKISPFKCIYMNVDRLSMLDCSALSMLIKLSDAAKKCHSSLVLEKPHGQVEQQLRVAAQYNSGIVIVG